ncbi:MAG: branched-chain amino acid ABC transporter permease [Phycisphaerae bacterium]|nr:branched-chain amino acid ABC transporter permease [Phycisphaerae bacterium]
MTAAEVFFQQVVNGLSNGMIIALIALGYTMVYGIVELINWAHGDLFMLGAFFALTLVGIFGVTEASGMGATGTIVVLLFSSALFCGTFNYAVDWVAYRPLRKAPKLTLLVTAIGISFIFVNIGLFWGGLPMEVFGGGNSAAAPKDFPPLVPAQALFGNEEKVHVSVRDGLVFGVTVPLMIALWWLVRHTKLGTAMRAVAQNPTAASLMGINVDRVIGATFFIGGALGGFASVVYSLYNNTISFQMGFRAGMDAFTAAVLGGIGSLPGAVLGGLLIGLTRSMSDQYLETQWTNTIVFAILILILVFRPSGLLGLRAKEKV